MTWCIFGESFLSPQNKKNPSGYTQMGFFKLFQAEEGEL